MHDVRNLIDVSTWCDEWPFLKLRWTRPEELEPKLKTLGIGRAFIGSIRTVFEQNPYRANCDLLENVHGEFFSPVIVVDPSYATWRRSFELAARDSRVRMIKLLPNYHGYDLRPEVLQPIVAAASTCRFAIGIQIRLEDQRGAYPRLTVPDLEVDRVVWAISAFPDQPFILHNLFIRELPAALHIGDNVYADLASVELHNTLCAVDRRVGLDRILFATHAPFYYPGANVCKLRYADLASRKVHQVGYANADALLSRQRPRRS